MATFNFDFDLVQFFLKKIFTPGTSGLFDIDSLIDRLRFIENLEWMMSMAQAKS